MSMEANREVAGNSLPVKADMNILPQSDSGLYAFGSVTIGSLFTIKDVKVVFLKDDDGNDKLTVCLPRYFNKRAGTWEPVMFLTKDQKAEVDKAVSADLHDKLLIGTGKLSDNLVIRTTLVSDSFYPTLGYGEVTYQDCLTVKHIRITQGENGLMVTFPSNQMKNGQYINLFGMATGEMQKEVEKMICDSFHKTYQEKHGKAYEGKKTAPSEGAALR